MRLSVLVLACWLPLGCSSSDSESTTTDTGITDTGRQDTCEAGKKKLYRVAGCDPYGTFVCVSEPYVGDACMTTFCGCDGKTFEGLCGEAFQPFASVGACGGGDAGPDAPADASADAPTDAPADG